MLSLPQRAHFGFPQEQLFWFPVVLLPPAHEAKASREAGVPLPFVLLFSQSSPGAVFQIKVEKGENRQGESAGIKVALKYTGPISLSQQWCGKPTTMRGPSEGKLIPLLMRKFLYGAWNQPRVIHRISFCTDLPAHAIYQQASYSRAAAWGTGSIFSFPFSLSFFLESYDR